ncbi:hypothetical protein MKW98_029456 [Papaver atlanticum]|uniref:Eukaryotic peptide chain release factor subunit 1 n=1 Tax=Papaver atlanticum TaxID=357466 RepID=A0AAD4SHM7_9MAGN|nr:hypothetical protein MKW98_029456 [Papaver atlanticum]
MSDPRETDDNIIWFPQLRQFRKISMVRLHKFGFIVMDGNEILFGTLCGTTREILHKFTIDLPNKNGRGGGKSAAVRFARLGSEECHNYVRKTAESATQFYIDSATRKPNVLGLILARSANFKIELSQSGMFDPRLQSKILKVVDVSCGGENGFVQAIKLSSGILANEKLVHETGLIEKYFKEIEQDTGKYVSGIKDTLKALEIGAVKTLIVWVNLDISRYVLQNSVTGEKLIHHFSKTEEQNQNNFRDLTNKAELKVLDKQSLVEWFATEYKQFGCAIEFVTDKSQKGSQFCRGYGGVGGVLHYQLDMRTFDELPEQ